MSATLTHPITGDPLPAILTTTEAAELLREHRDTVIDQCRAGLLPTMPRIGSAPHKIITAKLLRQLGLLPEPTSPTGPMRSAPPSEIPGQSGPSSGDAA